MKPYVRVLERCTAPCNPPCARKAVVDGLCIGHLERRAAGYTTALPLSVPVRQRVFSESLKRAADYAVGLLSDPFCAHTMDKAWERACDVEAVPRGTPVPDAVRAAGSRRSPAMEVSATFAGERRRSSFQGLEET